MGSVLEGSEGNQLESANKGNSCQYVDGAIQQPEECHDMTRRKLRRTMCPGPSQTRLLEEMKRQKRKHNVPQ